MPDGRTRRAPGSGRAGAAELCRPPRRRLAPLAHRSPTRRCRRAVPRRAASGQLKSIASNLTAAARPRGRGAGGAPRGCGCLRELGARTVAGGGGCPAVPAEAGDRHGRLAGQEPRVGGTGP